MCIPSPSAWQRSTLPARRAPGGTTASVRTNDAPQGRRGSFPTPSDARQVLLRGQDAVCTLERVRWPLVCGALPSRPPGLPAAMARGVHGAPRSRARRWRPVRPPRRARPRRRPSPHGGAVTAPGRHRQDHSVRTTRFAAPHGRNGVLSRRQPPRGPWTAMPAERRQAGWEGSGGVSVVAGAASTCILRHQRITLTAPSGMPRSCVQLQQK